MERPIVFEAREDDDEPLDFDIDPSEHTRIAALLGPSPISLDDLIRMSGLSPAIVRSVCCNSNSPAGLSAMAAGWCRVSNPEYAQTISVSPAQQLLPLSPDEPCAASRRPTATCRGRASFDTSGGR